MALRLELVACLARGTVAALALTLVACGGAPVAAEPGSALSEPDRSDASPARRRTDVVDDCAVVPGEPPPEPLLRKYEGVASAARCQREVYTIMGGLTHFLGVKCEHCHVKDDYPAPTHNKSVANWMARELIPRLEKKHSAAGYEARVWCNDCHVVNGKGTAKILGNPRKQAWAIEWMSTHLTDRFERSSDDRSLRCKDCHGANLGSPQFRKKIILTESLPPRPKLEAPTAGDAGDAGAVESAEPIAPESNAEGTSGE